MSNQRIRLLVICVFRKATSILVAKGTDSSKQQSFFRPIGGEIEFGELAHDALRREVREELKLEIVEPVRLGVLENRFQYEGRISHEVVFVFDAKFADPGVYNQSELTIHEEDIWEGSATWIDYKDAIGIPVYPDGLIKLLVETEPNAIKAHQHSLGNRKELEQSDLCGCFYCQAMFDFQAIQKWIEDESGDTARCPECGIDSVIGSQSGFTVSEKLLEEMNATWFN